jgi:myosin heavy subunit
LHTYVSVFDGFTRMYVQVIRGLEVDVLDLRSRQTKYTEAVARKSDEIKVLMDNLEELELRLEQSHEREEKTLMLLREEKSVTQNPSPVPKTIDLSMELDEERGRVAVLEAQNEALERKLSELKAAVESTETMTASEAFSSEVKWTEEIDRLEAIIADMTKASELVERKHEEEVIALSLYPAQHSCNNGCLTGAWTPGR